MHKFTGSNKIKAANIIMILLTGALSYVIYTYYPLILFKLEEDVNPGNWIITDNSIIDKENNAFNEIQPIRKENTLIIPHIGVNAKIWEGDNIGILDKKEGVWHEPMTSNPERGGNMVIAGHRRQFLPPNTVTFYLLPELKSGDLIIIYWENDIYIYHVIKSFETEKSDTFAYEKTNKSSLTLYTCSPLATAHRRWIVRAEAFQ